MSLRCVAPRRTARGVRTHIESSLALRPSAASPASSRGASRSGGCRRRRRADPRGTRRCKADLGTTPRLPLEEVQQLQQRQCKAASTSDIANHPGRKGHSLREEGLDRLHEIVDVEHERDRPARRTSRLQDLERTDDVGLEICDLIDDRRGHRRLGHGMHDCVGGANDRPHKCAIEHTPLTSATLATLLNSFEV